MSLKEKVLLLLKKREGEFLSGQEIALQLEVTRAGVWKAIKALQEEGYPIEAVTNRGYALQSMPDILSAVGIEQELYKIETDGNRRGNKRYGVTSRRANRGTRALWTSLFFATRYRTLYEFFIASKAAL